MHAIFIYCEKLYDQNWIEVLQIIAWLTFQKGSCTSTRSRKKYQWCAHLDIFLQLYVRTFSNSTLYHFRLHDPQKLFWQNGIKVGWFSSMFVASIAAKAETVSRRPYHLPRSCQTSIPTGFRAPKRRYLRGRHRRSGVFPSLLCRIFRRQSRWKQHISIVISNHDHDESRTFEDLYSQIST